MTMDKATEALVKALNDGFKKSQGLRDRAVALVQEICTEMANLAKANESEVPAIKDIIQKKTNELALVNLELKQNKFPVLPPRNLTNPSTTSPLNQTFTKSPNLPQAVQHIDLLRKAMSLLRKALRARGLTGLQAVQQALGIKNVDEFVNAISTQAGHAAISAKLRAFEAGLKAKMGTAPIDLNKIASPYARMMEAVTTLKNTLKMVGKIHSYIIRRGGVQGLLDPRKVSTGTLTRLSDLIYQVIKVLSNMDALDLSGGSITPETLKYINDLIELRQYVSEIIHDRDRSEQPNALALKPNEVTVAEMANKFKGYKTLELSHFRELFQVEPPNSIYPVWHFKPAFINNPIGSMQDLGDVYNGTFMMWVRGLPRNPLPTVFRGNKGLGIAQGAYDRFWEGPQEHPALTLERMFTDLYYRENALMNLYNGNLWLGITHEEGAALYKATFSAEANGALLAYMMEGKQPALPDPVLNSAIVKFADNYRKAYHKSQEYWHAMGVPVQSAPEGYIPKPTDLLKVRKISREEFIKAVKPLLDMKKMKIPTDPVIGGVLQSPQDMAKAQDEWIGAIYDHFVAVEESHLNYENQGLGSLFQECQLHFKDFVAAEESHLNYENQGLGSLFQECHLHFKDAGAHMTYQRLFGVSSSAMQGMADHLHTTARRQATTSILGPSSGRLVADLEAFMWELLGDARKKKTGEYAIANVLNILESFKDPQGQLSNPNLAVRVVYSIGHVVIQTALKALFLFGVFADPVKSVMIRQQFGFAPKTNPLITSLQAAGPVLTSLAHWVSGPFAALKRKMSGLSPEERQWMSDMAYAGHIFSQDAALVDRTNMTPSSKVYPWAQRYGKGLHKVVGSNRTTVYNRQQNALFFQKEMHQVIGTDWQQLDPTFRVFMERAGVTPAEWAHLQRSHGLIQPNVAPQAFGGRFQAELLSPTVMSNTFGQPGTVGYNPVLADIARKLGVAQAIYVGEGVLQTNPHVVARVLDRKQWALTDTQQGAAAIMINMVTDSWHIFGGWATLAYSLGRDQGLAKGVLNFLITTTFWTMCQLSFKAAITGKTLDWTDPVNWVKAAAVSGGGNYTATILQEVSDLLTDTALGTAGGKALALGTTTVLLSVNLGARVIDTAILDPLNWSGATTGQRKDAMKRIRRLSDFFVPQPAQIFTQRLLLDNFLVMWDPDAAEMLFKSEIKNLAKYGNAEYLPGLKPGDWTSQPLPDSLRSKQQYREEDTKKRGRAKELRQEREKARAEGKKIDTRKGGTTVKSGGKKGPKIKPVENDRSGINTSDRKPGGKK